MTHGEGGSYNGGREAYVPKRGCMGKEDQVVVVEQPMALEEDT